MPGQRVNLAAIDNPKNSGGDLFNPENLANIAAMIANLTFLDWLGVVGSLMVAGAYLAVSRGRVSAENPPFNILNLVGAVLILGSLYFRPNAGAILMELLWAMIAIYALIRWVAKR